MAPVVLSGLIALTVTVSAVAVRVATTRTVPSRAIDGLLEATTCASTVTVTALAGGTVRDAAGSDAVQVRVLGTPARGTSGTAVIVPPGPLIER